MKRRIVVEITQRPQAVNYHALSNAPSAQTVLRRVHRERACDKLKDLARRLREEVPGKFVKSMKGALGDIELRAQLIALLETNDIEGCAAVLRARGIVE